METAYLKSGRRVQYTGVDRHVRFGFYDFEIDDLIKTIEAAFEQKVFRCAALLQDLHELQDHFLEEKGHSMLLGAALDHFLALPEEEQTCERLKTMMKEAGP
jgi:hypothetical protein